MFKDGLFTALNLSHLTVASALSQSYSCAIHLGVTRQYSLSQRSRHWWLTALPQLAYQVQMDSLESIWVKNLNAIPTLSQRSNDASYYGTTRHGSERAEENCN